MQRTVSCDVRPARGFRARHRRRGVRRRRQRFERRRREDTSATAIESNPDNEGIELTIGSKNFDEQFILGEIYAQALEAAGYTVNTDLNLGSEQIALKALRGGRDLRLSRVHLDGADLVLRVRARGRARRSAAGLRGLARGVREEGAGGLPADPVLERERGRRAHRDGRGAGPRDDLGPGGRLRGPDPRRLARVP